ncbi:MAG: DUF3489 domain-containing protein [Thiotrichales bacterium]
MPECAVFGVQAKNPPGVDLDRHRLVRSANAREGVRHPGGATIAQMMAGTGWQAHTVRGAISGMVRKHLGYTVVTEKGRTVSGPIIA